MFDYTCGIVTFNLALNPVFTSLSRLISGLLTGFIYFGHIGERWEGTCYLSTDYYIVINGKETYYRKDPFGNWEGFKNLKKRLFIK